MIFNENEFHSSAITAFHARRGKSKMCVTALREFCAKTQFPLNDINLIKLNEVVDQMVFDTGYYE